MVGRACLTIHQNVTTIKMKIEYDHLKRLESRGLDFDDAPLLFASPRRITWPDSRQDYGEAREITMGELAGRLVIMVHTRRGAATRIISMRKANEREQRWFEKQFEEG
jgi:hypothetical protein